jgi:hypothetical protein
LKRRLGHALPEMAGCREIGFRGRNIGALIDVRLRRGAQPEAEPIEILL